MRILSIETSCDETAVSIVEATGDLENVSFKILGNALLSQIELHKQYGGVFPMMAKREHAKGLSPILKKVLQDSNLYIPKENNYSKELWEEIENILSRETGLYEVFKQEFEKLEKPPIDLIAVTSGPGLEPALWVGISFAMALSKLWNIPVHPTNHMEGHIASVLVESSSKDKVEFPALALLISGGHTELVKIDGWGNYQIIGQTRDDAVGEAFDKVARMLELPYPGGPEISKLAALAREKDMPEVAHFPRPMIHAHNLDFSFSGLKTSVLYYLRDHFKNPLTNEEKADIARAFEDAAIDVLLSKTEKAVRNTNSRTLIVAGGVIANKRLRKKIEELKVLYEINIKIPPLNLTTDNSVMIAAAAYLNVLNNLNVRAEIEKIRAEGNLKLGEIPSSNLEK